MLPICEARRKCQARRAASHLCLRRRGRRRSTSAMAGTAFTVRADPQSPSSHTAHRNICSSQFTP
eukprot:6087735-Pleurochrysis_carterae.AAC.1